LRERRRDTARAVIIPAAAARLRKVLPQRIMLAGRLARRSDERSKLNARGDTESVAVTIAVAIVCSAFARNRLV
jgi:hypothetical protein